VKKTLLLFCIPSILLSACGKNAGDNQKPIITIANANNSFYDYSIGLNQDICISLTDVIDEMLKEDDSYYLAHAECREISITGLDRDDQQINCLEFDLIHSKNSYSTLESSVQTVTIRCIEEFEVVSIGKMRFCYEEDFYDLEVDINLYFNKDYENYPSFLPSYLVDSRNWYNGGMFDYSHLRYAERNLEGFAHGYLYMFDNVRFNRDSDTIVLNNISFSDSVKGYIKTVKYGFFDPNIDPLEFDYDKISFKNWLNPVNLNEVTSEEKEIIFFFDTYDLSDQFFIGGDIIYDMTINGIDYQIKNMYLLFNCLL